MTVNEISTVFWSMLGTLMFVVLLVYLPPWLRFTLSGLLFLGLTMWRVWLVLSRGPQ